MKKKVLLIIESCNPEWSSVPLVGYNFFKQIKRFADVTLVTHERNRPALEKIHSGDKIVYIEPKAIEQGYYKIAARLSSFKGRVVWPIRHLLCYPLYFYFDANVRAQFAKRVASGEFDIVHAMTPMMPRYPVSIARDCNSTPFILGPVNGGVPFPPAFRSVGLKEFSQFNFLRDIGRWVTPGYRATYKKANLILAGSSYTKEWIERTLHVESSRTALVYENAVPDDFYDFNPTKWDDRADADSCLALLFVGRLVPYKGCDMLLKAIAKATPKSKRAIHLTIVGDGSEKQNLQTLAEELGVKSQTTFTGWIQQKETKEYYKTSDLFCFPSVREFGGAVVMEAMASGLPCVVVNNGGIGEYVDDSSGFRIDPQSESYVIDQLAQIIERLTNDQDALASLSVNAFERGKTFSWSNKGKEVQQLYDALEQQRAATEGRDD